MQNDEILGLDVGTVRTGIARASLKARLAEPLMSVETDCLFDCVNKLLKEHQADTVVVGLPRNLEGDDTEQTKWVRQWTEKAKNELSAKLFWQDEALTSEMAIQKPGKDGHDIDAQAAAAILQDFLDAPETERQAC